MNITKTLCLCAALSGAAGVQAMENREFVTQQDNTRVNNYQTNRPEASKRLFVSQEVERQIDHIKQLLTNAKLAWMFENCFPNTLDTTVHFDGKEDTFVYTGDIHAMGNRNRSGTGRGDQRFRFWNQYCIFDYRCFFKPYCNHLWFFLNLQCLFPLFKDHGSCTVWCIGKQYPGGKSGNQQHLYSVYEVFYFCFF